MDREPERHALHDIYILVLVAVASALIWTTTTWQVSMEFALGCLGLLWASSLSVINLHSTVVLMVLPVMLVGIMKYDAGSVALLAALGSISVQEYRIIVENNPLDLAILKLLGNRAAIALSAFASWNVFHVMWRETALSFSDPLFLLAAAGAGAAWVITSGVIVNIQIILTKPVLRFRFEPSIIFGSVNSLVPSVLMGLMGAAMYERGGALPFILAEMFFISNKNYTQRALIQKENAEQINFAMARIIESKDNYTAGHSERVAELARQLAEECRLSKSEVERIEYIARLHDVGKVNVPDSILMKPSRLTSSEYESVKKHPQWGAELIRGMDKIYNDRDYRAILEHHERYDGKGYPLGKKGDDISLWARILAVCDAWDAMTSERVYRPALSVKEAKAELQKNAGTQFDPQLVQLFVSNVQG